MDKRKTTTKMYTEEINEVLYSIDDYVKGDIKDYDVNFITLDCTEEDINSSLNESVIFRQYFKVENNKITVPVFFTCIEGVHDNIIDYLKVFNACHELENTLIIKNTNELLNEKFNDYSIINKFINNIDSMFSLTEKKYQKYFERFDNQFNIEKIINSKETNLSKYSIDLQKYLLNKLNEFINDYSSINRVEDKYKLRLLYLLSNLNRDMILLLTNFNISKISPKIVLYLEREEFLEKIDMLLLGYFRYIGMDIIVFSPAGLANLELVINEKMFSRIKLNSVNNGMNYWLLFDVIEYLNKSKVSINELDESFTSIGYNGKLEDYKKNILRKKYSSFYKINTYINGKILAILGSLGIILSLILILCNIITAWICIVMITIFTPLFLWGVMIMDNK